MNRQRCQASLLTVAIVLSLGASCTDGHRPAAPLTTSRVSGVKPAVTTTLQTNSTETRTTAPPTPVSYCFALPPAQTVTADLDGDGRPDQVTFTAFDPAGQSCAPFPAWRLDAELSNNGRPEMTIASGTALANDRSLVLGVVRLGPGRSQQVLLRGLGNSSQPVLILALSDGDLALASLAGAAQLEYSAFGHACCPFITADLSCPLIGGAPAVEQTQSMVAAVSAGPDSSPDPGQVAALAQSDPARLRRYWQRTIYRLEGIQLVPIVNDQGSIPFGAPAPAGVPLSNNLACQAVSQTGES